MSELGKKIDRHVGLMMDMGDLLNLAKAAIEERGEEPAPDIAPRIRALYDQSKPLAVEIGNMMLTMSDQEIRKAMGSAYHEPLVAAYKMHAIDPSEDTLNAILDGVLSAAGIKSELGRYGHGLKH